jgi:DNA-binding CsgD family transcriptional regulator
MLGNDFIAATLSSVRARFDVLGGDIDRARVELVAGLTSFRASDPQSWLPLVAAMLAETYAYLGESKQSMRAAAMASDHGPTLHFRSFELDRCLAWSLVATRDLRAAIAQLRRTARDARRDHHLAAETFALHDLSRLGDAHWAARRFDELAADWDSRWRQPFLDHAHGLRGGDSLRLESAANLFEEMGAWLWAAEAWAASHAAAEGSGLVVRASTAAQRGLNAIARCTGNVRTPALEPLLSRVRLTIREREVASLAAIGTPSKSIAAELGISARTVDNLLSRAYAKTGVNNRRDLGEVLGLEETG